MTKSSEQLISILGCLYANAIFVPILPALKLKGISHIIKNSGMKVIITDKSRFSEISNFKDILNIYTCSFDKNDGATNLLNQLDYLSVDDHVEFSRVSSDTAAIIYSSGSTGMPKGIEVTHKNLADGAVIVAKYLNTEESDKIAAILSFNFDYGLNQIWQSLYTGASLFLHELVFPNDCLDFIENEKITAIPLMPVVISKLFDRRFLDITKNHNFSHVKYICSSGGRLSGEMLKNVAETFPKSKFYSMYGLTEAFRSSFLEPSQLSRRPESIGKPIPDVQIYIMDEFGNFCSPNVVGELVHRGGCISKGYWQDELNTKQRFRSHEKFPGEILVYSGDLAYKDSEGFIYFVGRVDGMLKNNGIRVSPTEIEKVFDDVEEVSQVVVFGVDNIDVGSDIVVAYTTYNQMPLEQSYLLAKLKNLLPSHMLPSYLVHHKNFPSTGNQGKIDRSLVKKITIEQTPAIHLESK